jgi:hypothetical protein
MSVCDYCSSYWQRKIACATVLFCGSVEYLQLSDLRAALKMCCGQGGFGGDLAICWRRFSGNRRLAYDALLNLFWALKILVFLQPFGELGI